MGKTDDCEKQHDASMNVTEVQLSKAGAEFGIQLLKGSCLLQYKDPASQRNWFWHAAAARALFEDDLPSLGWSKFKDESGSRYWWWNEIKSEFFFEGGAGMSPEITTKRTTELLNGHVQSGSQIELVLDGSQNLKRCY